MKHSHNPTFNFPKYFFLVFVMLGSWWLSASVSQVSAQSPGTNATARLTLQQSVYAGNMGLAGCENAPQKLRYSNQEDGVTLCFKLINDGNSSISDIYLLNPVIGSFPYSIFKAPNLLKPGESLTFSYYVGNNGIVFTTNSAGEKTWTNESLIQATAYSLTGAVVENNGNVLGSAQVSLVLAEKAEQAVLGKSGLMLEKLVYAGHNNVEGCTKASSSMIAKVGDAITFCFIIQNNGEVTLGNLQLQDPLLNIQRKFDLPKNIFTSNSVYRYAVETYLDESWLNEKSGNTVYANNLALALAETVDADGHILNEGNYLGAMANVHIIQKDAIVANAVIAAETNPGFLSANVEEATATAEPTQTGGVDLLPKVVSGHVDASVCQGEDAKRELDVKVGDAVTFCFLIQNLGESPISNLTLNVPTLELSRTLLPSGENLVLLPNGAFLFSLQSHVKNTWFTNANRLDLFGRVEAKTSNEKGEIPANADVLSNEGSLLLRLQQLSGDTATATATPPALTEVSPTQPATNTSTLATSAPSAIQFSMGVLQGSQAIDACSGATTNLRFLPDEFVTFCFTVQNLGSEPLTRLSLKAELLGIEKELLDAGAVLSANSKLVYVANLPVASNWFVNDEDGNNENAKIKATLFVDVGVSPIELAGEVNLQTSMTSTPQPTAVTASPTATLTASVTPTLSPTPAIAPLAVNASAYLGLLGVDACVSAQKEFLYQLGEQNTLCIQIINQGTENLTYIRVENADFGIQADVLLQPGELPIGGNMWVALPFNVSNQLVNTKGTDRFSNESRIRAIQVQSQASVQATAELLLENGGNPSNDSILAANESATSATTETPPKNETPAIASLTPSPNATATIVPSAGTGSSDTNEVRGKVWYDINLNGVFDGNELGAGNVLIDVYSVSGQKMRTAVTSSDGKYVVSNLISGEFWVEINLPNGFSLTTTSMGANREIDSDFAKETRRTDIFVLNGNENRVWDAGLIASAMQTPTGTLAEGKKADTATPTPTDPIKKKDDVTPTPTDPIKKKDDVTPTPTDPIKKKDDVTPTPTDPIKKKDDVTPTPTDPIKKKEEPTATPTPTETPAVKAATLQAPIIAKSADLPQAKIGEIVTYSIRVTNNNTSPLTNITVSDTLDSRLDFISAESTIGEITRSGATISTIIDNLAPNQTAVLTIRARINPTAVPGTQISNIARVNSDGVQAGESQNVATDVVPANLPKTGNKEQTPMVHLLVAIGFSISMLGLASSPIFSKRKRREKGNACVH
jgi:uncharacterized repeat protein (TIGR01451 family)